MKYTPEYITELSSNQVFVFGSNRAGYHGAGAAKLALQKFGAKYGQGRGLQGQSYALPTKDFKLNTLNLQEIEREIEIFLDTAKANSNLEFFMTQIGCGLAGYNAGEIAPLFNKFELPDNVVMSEVFAEYLNQYNPN